jgi:hypothetical protein
VHLGRQQSGCRRRDSQCTKPDCGAVHHVATRAIDAGGQAYGTLLVVVKDHRYANQFYAQLMGQREATAPVK